MVGWNFWVSFGIDMAGSDGDSSSIAGSGKWALPVGGNTRHKRAAQATWGEIENKQMYQYINGDQTIYILESFNKNRILLQSNVHVYMILYCFCTLEHGVEQQPSTMLQNYTQNRQYKTSKASH